MKNMKRIHKVVIKRMYDDSPDTSWLGEYSNKATSEYSIDRAHSLDCAINSHVPEKLEQDIQCDDCGELTGTNPCSHCDTWACNCSGGADRREYRYFNPSFNYVDKTGKALPENTPEEVRKYVLQDYKRMEALHRGDWSFLGVRADAQVSFGKVHGDSYLLQDVTSGGLWGIESDSGDYFKEVESEQLSELRDQLHKMGFSQRAISAAFKNIVHGGDAA